MKIIPKPSKKGPRGEAAVTVTSKVVQINFPGTGIFEFPAAELPKTLRSGNYYAVVSNDGETLMGLSPMDGMILARVKKFAASEGQPPSPKASLNSQFNPGGLYFTIICEATYGPTTGCEFAMFMDYLFIVQDGAVVIQGGGKSAAKLDAFIECNRVDPTTLPLVTNVLPAIQEQIVENDFPVFTVVFQGGKVQSIAPALDAAPAKKKPAAKKILKRK